MAEYVEKLKEAFSKLFGEQMNIWEEVVVDSVPEEFEKYFKYVAESAIRLADIIELDTKRLSTKLLNQEVEGFRDWLSEQSPEHVCRLRMLTYFVTTVTAAMIQISREML